MVRTRRALFDLAAALLAAVAIASCAGDARVAGEAAAASAITMGTATSGDPAVVALATRRVHCHETFVETFCTGVLVGDRVVLTAAHCVLGQTDLDLEVFVGDRANGGTGTFYAVVDQRVHPQYDPVTFDDDLALLTLAIAPGVAPATLDAGEPPPSGAQVRVVGFGGEGNGSDGVKREGTSKLTDVSATLLRTEPSPSLACGGDSGAPVFREDTGAVVGIVRSGDMDCKAFTNATRLSSFVAPFIAPYIAAPPAPKRRGASLREPLCSEPCAADDDCPRGMLCLPERPIGQRCGYAVQRSGQLTTPCEQDDECASKVCAASGPGDEGRTCGCFVGCQDLPSSTAPPAEIVGGGCSASRRSSCAVDAGGLLTATAASLAALRRRRRRSARSFA